MNPQEHLLIFGASTRAAAGSALRAGMRPWCADLFADADLQAHCPVIEIPPDQYPRGLPEIADQGPPGPWMYTGALENRAALVHEMARRRPLWGNDASVLQRARSPEALTALLNQAGLPCPAVRSAGSAPPDRRWLLKPRSSAGGAGVRFHTGRPNKDSRPLFLQEFIEGEPCAAVYVGDGSTARLLGVTRQLVGESWLHAAPFHYCGSIGPLALEPNTTQAFERLGTALASGCGLRGLFGVDGVLRDGLSWPVEANPRYTASVEVLEHAQGISALALHRRVFDPHAPHSREPQVNPALQVGKAILFARAPLVFPRDGPWASALHHLTTPDRLPAFADIPRAGQLIATGRPILTFFARADSPEGCRDALQQMARDLDRWLFA